MHTQLQRAGRRPDAVTPQATGAISIPNFPAIYGASSLPSATTGTIGIITSGKLTQTITDLKSFASSAGYPVPNVTTTVVGTAGTSTSGTDEWNMDSQSSLAAAGGTIAQMILYNVNSLSDANLTQGYNKAVTDNKARAINVSLGGCESDEGSVEATQDADLPDGRRARPDVLGVVGRLRRLRVRRDRRQGAELPGRLAVRHGRRRHDAVDHRRPPGRARRCGPAPAPPAASNRRPAAPAAAPR